MIVDLHAHLVSAAADPARTRLNVWNRTLMRIAGFASASDCRERFVRDLREGPVGRAVVCAIEGSPLVAGNREVAAFCRANPGFLYGANLDPRSPGIEDEMDAALSDGAVLLKLMPSFQGVDPASPGCDRYWAAAAARRLPVIVHTGPEHMLARGDDRLNSPARLERAAATGATLVCAHCGCQLASFVERSHFGAWKRLVRRFPNVYGDVSGFSGIVRRFWLGRIVRDPLLRARLVFGTDYPAFVHVFRPNRGNVFAAWVELFRRFGLGDDFFARGGKLIGREVAE